MIAEKFFNLILENINGESLSDPDAIEEYYNEFLSSLDSENNVTANLHSTQNKDNIKGNNIPYFDYMNLHIRKMQKFKVFNNFEELVDFALEKYEQCKLNDFFEILNYDKNLKRIILSRMDKRLSKITDIEEALLKYPLHPNNFNDTVIINRIFHTKNEKFNLKFDEKKMTLGKTEKILRKFYSFRNKMEYNNFKQISYIELVMPHFQKRDLIIFTTVNRLENGFQILGLSSENEQYLRYLEFSRIKKAKNENKRIVINLLNIIVEKEEIKVHLNADFNIEFFDPVLIEAFIETLIKVFI
jgi:hypothetical protein